MIADCNLPHTVYI